MDNLTANQTAILTKLAEMVNLNELASECGFCLVRDDLLNVYFLENDDILYVASTPLEVVDTLSIYLPKH